MHPALPSNITVVHVICTAYSGSTWVNMLLGSHSRALAVGELKYILRDAAAPCNFHGPDCPLWSRFDPTLATNPFRQLADLSGRQYLVVNNSRKFMRYQSEPGIDSRYVHLMRDGRAAAASRMRKDPPMNMRQAARWWAHDAKRNLRLMRSLPAEQVTTLSYEKLYADTEGELRRLAAFIGYDYEPRMLEYWDQVDHYLGGNVNTMKRVANQRGVEVRPHAVNVAPSEVEREAAAGTTAAGFTLDERWRRELSPRQLWAFSMIAGRVNSRLGYGGEAGRAAPAGGRA